MTWRWAFSANAFKRFGWEETLRAIAGAGYQGAELLADVPHLLPERTDEGVRRRVRKVLAETGLALSNLNAFTLFAHGDTYHPSWTCPDGEGRRVRWAHTEAALRLAADLGCPTISTEPGGLAGEWPNRVQALAWFREGLEEVLPLAERLNVRLLVEPEPGCLLERPEETRTFLGRLGSPWVGMNYDLGHFYCVGVDLVALIEADGRRIPHIHLEDIAADRHHEHLLPGAGAIPFSAVLASLSRAGYDGFVTVELYPYQDDPAGAASAALDYLNGQVR